MAAALAALSASSLRRRYHHHQHQQQQQQHRKARLANPSMLTAPVLSATIILAEAARSCSSWLSFVIRTQHPDTYGYLNRVAKKLYFLLLVGAAIWCCWPRHHSLLAAVQSRDPASITASPPFRSPEPPSRTRTPLPCPPSILGQDPPIISLLSRPFPFRPFPSVLRRSCIYTSTRVRSSREGPLCSFIGWMLHS